MPHLLKNAITVLASILVTLLVIESALYFMPVNEGLKTQPVSAKSPIIHFEKNRTSTWSRFPDFSIRNTVRANNFGFINDQDYEPKSPRPLIAVIGDSYVEAAMVPYAKTFHGLLSATLHDSTRVYSFGASGAPLSQYLAFAQYARQTFRPHKMIIVVIANDFDESLLEYKAAPGMHYFRNMPDDSLQLKRIDYSPSLATRTFRNSKLAMYLMTNLNVHSTLSTLLTRKDAEYVGQTSTASDTHRITQSKKAINAFFDLLPAASGLAPQDILFVIDGLRPHLYTREGIQSAQGSYAQIMMQYFLSQAQLFKYTTVDLSPVFMQDFKRHGVRFEYPKDGHWNDYGHAVVAKAIASALQPTQ